MPTPDLSIEYLNLRLSAKSTLVLNIDTSRARRTPVELLELVQAVVRASPNDESDSVEWKASLDLSKVEGFGHVLRNILGFANRDPARAAKWFQGCAYIVVGAEPENIAGVVEIDPAQLDDKMRPFLGSPGPAWSPTWLHVDGRSVLVVTVEPPSRGDWIWILRRAFDHHQVGKVFIRQNGKTVQASEAEHDMLQRRLLARSDGIAVRLEWTAPAPPSVPSVRISKADVDAWLRAERAACLSSLPSRDASSGMFLGAKVVNPSALMPFTEDRTQDQYRSQVDSYIENARSAVPYLALRATKRDRQPFELDVVNDSDRNFSGVEIVIDIRERVFGVDADADALEAFQRPRKYGTARQPWLGGQSFVPHRLADATFLVPKPRIENDGSLRISFPPVTLRPRGRVTLDPFWLAAPETVAGHEVPVFWEATALDANGVASGQLSVRIDDSALSVDELLEHES